MRKEIIHSDGQTWPNQANEDAETIATNAEHAVSRAQISVERWHAVCVEAMNKGAAQTVDIGLLQIIGLHNRPKTVRELAAFTNRDDIPNIQYALRKLLRENYVAKKGSGRTGVTYEATERGRKLTDEFATLNRLFLIEEIRAIPGFAEQLIEATKTLDRLKDLYDAACRRASD